MLFRELIIAYSVNNMKPTDTLWQNVHLLIVKAGGACSYQWILKG